MKKILCFIAAIWFPSVSIWGIDYRLVPNPYNPAKNGFLQISKKDGSNLNAGRYSLRVHDYNLKLVYQDTYELTAAGTIRYPGITQNGSKLAPGLYFLQIVSSDSAAQTTSSDFTKLLVQ